MSSTISEQRFSPEDRKLLWAEGYRIEKHPNVPEFAIKKEGFSININEDGSLSAGYDSGESEELDENVKVCETVHEALNFLANFS